MSEALTSKMGRVWIQPGGPNKPVYLLSCVDLGDLAETAGGIELIRCRTEDNKFKVVASTESPPDPVTTSLNGLLFPERSWLEQQDCPFALYVLMRTAGNAGIFSNYVRGEIVQHARITGKTYAALVEREEDNPSTVEVDIEAWPPILPVNLLNVQRVGTVETLGALGVAANLDLICAGGELPEVVPGEEIVVSCKSDVSPAVAHVLRSINSGGSFAATAANPFSTAARDAVGIVRFMVGKTIARLLAASAPAVGAQGYVSYSDDGGANWTELPIGGATAAHGLVRPAGLFALDRTRIYHAGAKGYIYRSYDGGENWAVKEAGVISNKDYAGVHFADESYGIAVTESGVVVLSDDGGESWYAATPVTGTPDLTACWRIDKNRMWVGDEDGVLWFSEDGGASWHQRSGWPGSGTGEVRGLYFVNEYQGFMIHNDASPKGTVLRTFNGGYDWEALATPTNAGLNAIYGVNQDLAYVTGDASGGTAVILKVTAV